MSILTQHPQITTVDAKQLALIRAHPELAGKAAIDRTLTAASAAEQASAGLDTLTDAERERVIVDQIASMTESRLERTAKKAAAFEGYY